MCVLAKAEGRVRLSAEVTRPADGQTIVTGEVEVEAPSPPMRRIRRFRA
ncbi:hypothetical protein ACFSHQ_09400 [Gemmobacter lanyuensis]